MIVLNLQDSGGHVVFLLEYLLVLDSKLNFVMTDCMAKDSVGREKREKERERNRHNNTQSDRDRERWGRVDGREERVREKSERAG